VSTLSGVEHRELLEHTKVEDDAGVNCHHTWMLRVDSDVVCFFQKSVFSQFEY